MGKTGAQSGMARISFRLERDSDGYPPADWETLWARPLRDAEFEIDSIPFFVRGISVGDVVAARALEGQLEFQKVVRRAGNRTLRVLIRDTAETEVVRAELRRLGCDTELSHLPSLVAVNVPVTASLDSVVEYLGLGEGAGRWEFEEADVDG